MSSSQSSEHYPSKNESTIQNAISSIAAMEKDLDDLSSQVAEMKKKLLAFAEQKADEANAEIIDKANKEAQAYLDSVKKDAEAEAEKIIQKGDKDTEALKKRVSGNISSAVDIIVKSVLTI